MEQNLRAYFVLYAITIKWIMCVEKRINLSSMSQRPRLISSNISGDLCLTTKIKQQHKIAKRTLRGGNKLAYYFPGGAFATPCQPMFHVIPDDCMGARIAYTLCSAVRSPGIKMPAVP